LFEVVAQMGVIILFGVVWRVLKPGGLDPQVLRKALTDTVYFLLLPALVLSILWRTELSIDSFRIVILAIVGVFAGFFVGKLICRWTNMPSATAGAAILAAAFPNATYLGLPVLETTLGSWASGVAIQYDLFACTPLLFSLGIMVAIKYGSGEGEGLSIASIFKIPAVIAAIVAVMFNLNGIEQPQFVFNLLSTLDTGVVPLMLFSLGLSLQWRQGEWKRLPLIVPVVLIQLVIMPAVVLALNYFVGLDGQLLTAVVIEAAMPSMVIGLVLCDRFKLDSSFYATAVTTSTALSLISLPLWFSYLDGFEPVFF